MREGMSLRGIEHMANSSSINERIDRRRAVVEAVMEEQDLQRYEGVEISAHFELKDRLADASKIVTAEAREVALQKGLADQRAADEWTETARFASNALLAFAELAISMDHQSEMPCSHQKLSSPILNKSNREVRQSRSYSSTSLQVPSICAIRAA